VTNWEMHHVSTHVVAYIMFYINGYTYGFLIYIGSVFGGLNGI